MNNRKFDFDAIFRTILVVIPIGVLANIIFSLLKTDKNFFLSLHRFSYDYLLLVVVLGLVPWFTGLLRLCLWTRFLGKPLSFRDLFRIILGTELGSAVSPTAVGGGYVKVGMLMQKGYEPGESASLMLLNTVEDGLFFMLALPAAFVTVSATGDSAARGLLAKAENKLSLISDTLPL